MQKLFQANARKVWSTCTRLASSIAAAAASSSSSSSVAGISVSQCSSYGNLFFHLLNYSSPNLAKARRFHALLLVRGIVNPNSTGPATLGTQLVKAYVKLSHFDDALRVFYDTVLQHNNNNIIVAACNALLRGYVDAAQFSQAIDFFHRFGQALVPDNFTYPLILEVCAALSALEQGRI